MKVREGEDPKGKKNVIGETQWRHPMGVWAWVVAQLKN
jgi:hypothetical protein